MNISREQQDMISENHAYIICSTCKLRCFPTSSGMYYWDGWKDD